MPILKWDKPERRQSIEEWKSFEASDAPPGTYIPNMSDEDRHAWKAKLTRKTTEHPQVEIRKSLSGTELVVIVGGNGRVFRRGELQHADIIMSANGPMAFSWVEWVELATAVEEACRAMAQGNAD